MKEPSNDLVGKRLDKYEVIALLGVGGMGAVYEAQHAATQRRVAIKVISGDLTPDDSLLARFQREARAAGAIESRHIAQVLDAGKDGETGAPYLVMELLKGEDLDTLVKRMAPFRPSLAIRIAAQALAGLERAHSANVVHRDIKPANLYLASSDGGERIVKIVDFGIAKVKDDLTASREFSLTQTASLLGSPIYMSPEQARTSKTVDGRADLWSLGVVFYQMLTGRPPHADATSLTELLLAICTEPAAPVQDRAPWVPAEIARIAERAITIDQSARFGTATEMLAAMTAIAPDWHRIDESMLMPMTDVERSSIAPRADPPVLLGVSTGPAPPFATVEAATVVPRSRESTPNLSARTIAEPRSRSSLASLDESAPGVNATSAPGTSLAEGLGSTRMEASTSLLAGRRPRTKPLVFVAAGLVAAVTVGLATQLRRPPDPAPRVQGNDGPRSSDPPMTPTSPPPEPAATSATTPATVPSAPSSLRADPGPPRPVGKVPSAKASSAPSAAPRPPERPTATTATTKPTAAPSNGSPISRDFN